MKKKYTKKEILEFYVNDSYLGNGAYGVEQASQNYFGKSVSELNLAEASFIAGLFQAPSSYDPYNYPDKAENNPGFPCRFCNPDGRSRPPAGIFQIGKSRAAPSAPASSPAGAAPGASLPPPQNPQR